MSQALICRDTGENIGLWRRLEDENATGNNVGRVSSNNSAWVRGCNLGTFTLILVGLLYWYLSVANLNHTRPARESPHNPAIFLAAQVVNASQLALGGMSTNLDSTLATSKHFSTGNVTDVVVPSYEGYPAHVAVLSSSSSSEGNSSPTHQCPSVQDGCSTVLLKKGYCLYYLDDALLTPKDSYANSFFPCSAFNIEKCDGPHHCNGAPGKFKMFYNGVEASDAKDRCCNAVSFNPEHKHSSGREDDNDDDADDDGSNIHYPCSWCLRHKQSCPSTRVFTCMLQRGGGRWNEDGTIIMALWNTVIALSYASLAILISNTTVLLFVRNSVIREAIVLVESVRAGDRFHLRGRVRAYPVYRSRIAGRVGHRTELCSLSRAHAYLQRRPHYLQWGVDSIGWDRVLDAYPGATNGRSRHRNWGSRGHGWTTVVIAAGNPVSASLVGCGLVRLVGESPGV